MGLVVLEPQERWVEVYAESSYPSALLLHTALPQASEGGRIVRGIGRLVQDGLHHCRECAHFRYPSCLAD
jgi:hypothetical protein